MPKDNEISQNPHDWYLRAKAQRDELTERCKSLWARLREAQKQIASLKMEVELLKTENEKLHHADAEFLARLGAALDKVEPGGSGHVWDDSIGDEEGEQHCVNCFIRQQFVSARPICPKK